MDPEFWHTKWHSNQIGFHQSEVNPMLTSNIGRLKLSDDARVFVPMCGKTRDIAWLLSKGYQVVGAELSELAVEQLFDEAGLRPEITDFGNLKQFSAVGLDVFVGDIFDLTPETLGRVDAVYDRAALVALPDEMRNRYARHVADVSGNAPQLLITFNYDQSKMNGPPFSLSNDGIKGHFMERFELSLLADEDVAGGLKGECEAREKAWLLWPRSL